MRRKESVVRILGVSLALAMIAGLGGLIAPSSPVLADDPVVSFPDANLEAAIREAIDKPDDTIYASDLEGLTYLDASMRRVSDLTGLEHCIDLTDLSLGHNQISDLSPLTGLNNLTRLYLEGNQISDVSPLANLTKLTELFLGHNQISDISALTDLSSLTFLHLGKGRNQISDISPLANLTNLTHLNLGGNQISDISPLSSLTELTFLRIFGNQISDLSALENLANMSHLHLGANRIEDISPLGNLTSLNFLDLWGNRISDISPLGGLSNLQSVHFSYNNVSDISPLTNLTSLTELGIPRNPISDLSPIADLTSLRVLHVTIESVNDIPLLLDLANLTALGLHIRQISDAELPGLADVRDMLIGLDIWGAGISDISPLANLTNLTDLRIWGNEISNISPLQGLTNLTVLFLNNNQITDVSPLEGLTNLRALRLHSNQISDIKALVDNSGLAAENEIWLGGNPLSAQSINEYIPALQARGVIVHYDEDLVGFACPNLEAAIREAIDKPEDPIYRPDLEGLTSLEADDRGISDLTGLEYCINLTHLSFRQNQISNISPPTGLSSLTYLNLGHNQISHISPLVDNIGFGEGDYIDFRYNYLDLTPSSQAMNDIQTLLDRGVDVLYEPQSEVRYELTIFSSEGGAVTAPGEGTFNYAANTLVALVATPDAGYHFVEWTGDVITIDNVNSVSTTITMNGGYSITANFQPTVESVEASTGTGTVYFTTSHGNIEDLKAIPALSPAPRGVTFPHGMFEFKITGLADGATVTLTIELPQAVPVGFVWWKHDGTRWYSLPNLDDNGDNTMVIELTDGGLGDTPESPDGEVHDPGGPGNPMSPLTVGWEGSSVDKAAVMAPWITLLTVIAGASLLILRRRQTPS